MASHDWPDSVEFDALFDQFGPRGLSYAHAVLSNRAEAEDVVQEAFCRLMQRIQQRRFRDTDEFAAVFFTTIRNLSIDALRKRSRGKFVSLADHHELAAPYQHSSDLVWLQSEVDKAMRELPANWAEALRLRVAAELSYEEIAKVMEATRAQVRTWIYRARRRLELELAIEKSQGNSL